MGWLLVGELLLLEGVLGAYGAVRARRRLRASAIFIRGLRSPLPE